MTRRMVSVEERKQLLNVYVDTPYFRWIREAATRRNMAQSAIVREALVAYVTANGGLDVHGEPDSPG